MILNSFCKSLYNINQFIKESGVFGKKANDDEDSDSNDIVQAAYDIGEAIGEEIKDAVTDLKEKIGTNSGNSTDLGDLIGKSLNMLASYSKSGIKTSASYGRRQGAGANSSDPYGTLAAYQASQVAYEDVDKYLSEIEINNIKRKVYKKYFPYNKDYEPNWDKQIGSENSLYNKEVRAELITAATRKRDAANPSGAIRVIGMGQDSNSIPEWQKEYYTNYANPNDPSTYSFGAMNEYIWDKEKAKDEEARPYSEEFENRSNYLGAQLFLYLADEALENGLGQKNGSYSDLAVYTGCFLDPS